MGEIPYHFVTYFGQMFQCALNVVAQAMKRQARTFFSKGFVDDLTHPPTKLAAMFASGRFAQVGEQVDAILGAGFCRELQEAHLDQAAVNRHDPF